MLTVAAVMAYHRMDQLDRIRLLGDRAVEHDNLQPGWRSQAAVLPVMTEEYSCAMKLKQSNPYLKSERARKAGLRVSAQTSSAVEGIRAPFVKSKSTAVPASTEAFIARWKRRVAAIGR